MNVGCPKTLDFREGHSRLYFEGTLRLNDEESLQHSHKKTSIIDIRHFPLMLVDEYGQPPSSPPPKASSSSANPPVPRRRLTAPEQPIPKIQPNAKATTRVRTPRNVGATTNRPVSETTTTTTISDILSPTTTDNLTTTTKQNFLSQIFNQL